MIDENIVNSIVANIVTTDNMYSLRRVVASNPRTAPFVHLFTTTNVGFLLPSFKEDYGEGKPVDAVGTLSHEIFAEKIDNVQMSGISIDKNGVLRATINALASIMVETFPGEWEDTRQFYLTLNFKGKLYINETDTNKSLTLLPKALEI